MPKWPYWSGRQVFLLNKKIIVIPIPRTPHGCSYGKIQPKLFKDIKN